MSGTPSLARRILCRGFRLHDRHTCSTDDGGLSTCCRACHRDRAGRLRLGAHVGSFG